MSETENIKREYKRIAIHQVKCALDRFRELKLKVMNVNYYLSLLEKDREDLDFVYRSACENVVMLLMAFEDVLLKFDNGSFGYNYKFESLPDDEKERVFAFIDSAYEAYCHDLSKEESFN